MTDTLSDMYAEGLEVQRLRDRVARLEAVIGDAANSLSIAEYSTPSLFSKRTLIDKLESAGKGAEADTNSYYRGLLARQIRQALGPHNNDAEPVVYLVAGLVAEVERLKRDLGKLDHSLSFVPKANVVRSDCWMCEGTGIYKAEPCDACEQAEQDQINKEPTT